MKRIILVLIIIVSGSLAHAQEVFRATVVDSATFKPMPYVSILIKSKGRGTITDVKGNFLLGALRQDTLVFSFVGYNSLEYPLANWEPGLIRLSENKTVLKNIVVQAKAINPYQGMFDDQNAMVAARRNKFYDSRIKKEKRKLVWLKEDNQQAKTYVEVVIENPDLKNSLMKEYGISEEQYYTILADFNAKNKDVMYYLTAGELITLVKKFYKRSVNQ